MAAKQLDAETVYDTVGGATLDASFRAARQYGGTSSAASAGAHMRWPRCRATDERQQGEHARVGGGTKRVNVTSATTRVATAGVAPCAAFKGGLEVLTRYMAKEFGDRKIRVNAVSPGPIRTELGGGLTPAFEALLASQTALGRVGEPDDVGRVIATLLSEEGGWINGQSIEVAGGYLV